GGAADRAATALAVAAAFDFSHRAAIYPRFLLQSDRALSLPAVRENGIVRGSVSGDARAIPGRRHSRPCLKSASSDLDMLACRRRVCSRRRDSMCWAWTLTRTSSRV